MYSMYLAAMLAITVALAHGAEENGEGDVLIPFPHYKEETLLSVAIGNCHKDTFEALPNLRDLRITCIDEAVNATGLRDFYDNDIEIPATSDAFVRYLYAFEACKLRVSGALRDDTVDFDAYISFLDLPEGHGEEEILMADIRSALHTCRGVSGGPTPVDTMLNFDRCIEIKRLENCEFNDLQIGFENLLRVALLSANIPSKCPEVKMPENDYDEWVACADKLKDSFEIPALDGTDEARDIAFLVLDKEYVAKIPNCFVKSKGFSTMIEYILNLDGWQHKPQQRMEIFSAYATCAKYFQTPVKFKKHEDGYDSNREREARVAKFHDCVGIEVFRICGLNSDVAWMITPPLSAVFRENAHKVYKDLTGEIPYHLIETFKVALFGP